MDVIEDGRVAAARRLLEDRMADIDKERPRLERALTELGARGAAGRPRRKPNKLGTHDARVGGGRAVEAKALVDKRPSGIAANEVAKEIGIPPSYLYRVLGALADAGEVRKDGRLYFPASPRGSDSGRRGRRKAGAGASAKATGKVPRPAPTSDPHGGAAAPSE